MSGDSNSRSGGRRGGSRLLADLGRHLLSQARGIVRFIQLSGAFRKYFKPYTGTLAFAVFLSLLYSGLRLLEPWPLQILFDQAILDKHTTFLGLNPLALLGGNRELLLVLSALAVLVVAVLSGSVYYTQSILIARVGQDIVRDMREDVFHQLQRLSLPFHRRSSTGDLLMRLTGDMLMLREMILATLVTLTTHLLFLAAVFVLMLTVSLKLTIISLLLAPGLYFLFRWFRQRMVQAARKQRRREGRLATAIEEVLLAIPMIQAYTAEEQEDERFRKITKKSARAGLRAARLEAGMQRMVGVVIALGTALVLLFGVREILRGALTPGVFLVFLAYLRAMNKPVRGLSKVTERTARASAAAERVLEVLRAKREIKDRKGAVEARGLRGEIKFSDVSFTYEDGTVALKDVGFRIEPGQHVALVGPSGAGKTSLLSLILRFHKPERGKIRIDGRNIKDYTLRSLRQRISFLPQEPFILGTSFRENLLYGDPQASEEQLWEALGAVDLDEFVRSLPKGLDEDVRPRGQSLSGGQKQKLAVARALLKDAPILLLDEPTTAMDARTEQEVLRNLERLRAGRTTVTIAHHFGTVRSADLVLVLDDGRLVEMGRPDELLSRESLFRLLADLQGFTAPGGSRNPTGRDVPIRGKLQSDPSVPGVVRLLENHGPAEFVDGLSPFVDLGSNPTLTAVKQRPGQRALIRIDGGEGAAGRFWFAKLLRTSKGSERAEQLARISEEARREDLCVPRTVAYLPGFRALVTEGVEGTPILGSSGPVETGPRPHETHQLFRDVGRCLARVHHGLTPPGNSRGPCSERETLRRVLPVLEEHRCDLLPAYEEALIRWWCERFGEERLDGGGGGLEVGVALHGDFYPAQVLELSAGAGRPRLAFLDWDESCLGEPERDVANFQAHVTLEAVRRCLTVEESSRLQREFEAGYRDVAGLDADRLRWYRRASLLRLSALHARPGFGAAPPNPESLADGLLSAATSAGEDPAPSTRRVSPPKH